MALIQKSLSEIKSIDDLPNPKNLENVFETMLAKPPKVRASSQLVSRRVYSNKGTGIEIKRVYRQAEPVIIYDDEHPMDAIWEHPIEKEVILSKPTFGYGTQADYAAAKRAVSKGR